MKNKKLFISGVCFALILVFILSGFVIFAKLYSKNKALGELSGTIRKEAVDFNAEYSFLIQDLNFPSAKASFNSDKKFVAASLIKLPLLAVVFVAVEEGKISLNDRIVINKSDITGGSGKIKAMDLPLELDLNRLIELIITISDNTATNKVISLLGFDYINDKFKELGLKHTSLSRNMMDFSMRSKGVENYVSARDIAYILNQIYAGKLVNKELSGLGLSLLKKQKVNDRLPRYLPKETVIAHKTGLERGVVHDAGIVFTGKAEYIICVLVQKTKSYDKAKKMIARISLLTYNLYQ